MDTQELNPKFYPNFSAAKELRTVEFTDFVTRSDHPPGFNLSLGLETFDGGIDILGISFRVSREVDAKGVFKQGKLYLSDAAFGSEDECIESITLTFNSERLLSNLLHEISSHFARCAKLFECA